MRWRVEVFGGVVPAPEVLQRAPVEINDSVTVVVEGDGSLSSGVHDSAYVGVRLETRSPGSVSMVADGIAESLHVMENVWHVYFGPTLEIEGMEARPDGTLVHSRWECTPSGPTAKDEEILAWLDEQT